MKGMTWRHCPRLFANGEFLALTKYENGEVAVRKITGIMLNTDRGDCFCFDDTYLPLDMHTLIARRVQDMDHSEVATALSFQDIYHEGRDFHYYRRWLEGCVNEWVDFDEDWQKERLSAKCQNYLLSIGVYPFSQSHFSDGIVFAPGVK